MLRWLVAAWLLALPMVAAGPLDGSLPGARSVADRQVLDVVGTIQAWPEDRIVDISYGPAFLPRVGGGHVAVLSDPLRDGGCELLFTDEHLAQTARRNVAACDDDEGTSILLAAGPTGNVLCRRQVAALSTLVLLVDDQAETLWSVRAADILPSPGQDGVLWSCNGGVWNGDVVVVALTQESALSGSGLPGRHAIAAFDAATGETHWLTQLLMGDHVSDLVGDGIQIREGQASPGFAPLTVTPLPQGYIVTGRLLDSCGVMLLHLDGRFETFLYTSETSTGRPAVPTEGLVVDQAAEALPNESCTGWGAVAGASAVSGFGSEVVRLDPTAPAIIDRRVPEVPFRFEPHRGLGPVLSGDQVAIPVQSGIVVVDRDDLEVQWVHRMSPESFFAMWDVATTPAGGFWLLGRDSQSNVYVDRLAADGSLVQRLPLDLDLPGGLASGSGLFHSALRIVPLRNGFAAVDLNGKAILLGESDPGLRPILSLADAYPSANEVVALDVAASPEGNTTVYWGDGQTVPVAADGRATLETFYDSSGDRTIRVTTVYPDGRTATSALTLHVGGTPPAKLTFLQEAFAPGRQDTTWGILGLIVAFLGGVGAYAAQHWRRRGVARQLRALDVLRARASHEPIEALEGLRAFRWSLRSAVERGRIDGSQYASLLQEADRLGRALEIRLWGVLRGRLGPALRGAVEAALTDGHLTPQERTDLQAELRSEKRLSPREREAFGRILSGWAT